MRFSNLGICLALVLVASSTCPAWSQGSAPPSGPEVRTVRPQFLPPAELCRVLGMESADGCGRMPVGSPAGPRFVEIRRNDGANLLVLSGDPADVAVVAELVRQVDVAPRQIEIDVKLVDINRTMARDLGIDWESVVEQASPSVGWQYTQQKVDDTTKYLRDPQTPSTEHRQSEEESNRRQFLAGSHLDVGSALSFLDESGAANVRNAPRILTVNNRRATILDGQRVTYVTRYSSYTNLYQTDSLDTGVRLSVVPSLGESGYLTLEVEAELTSLSGDISGSPVKDGQIVENTVVVKSGQTVLLGGLTRSLQSVSHRRFPVLGHILPFLFSREVKTESVMESYVLLTPRVVDLGTAIDPATLQRIDSPPERIEPGAAGGK